MPTFEELREMQCTYEKPRAYVEFERQHGMRAGRTPPRGKITEWTIVHPMLLDTGAKMKHNGRCVVCFCRGHLQKDCPETSEDKRHKRCSSCHQKGHRSSDCLWKPLPRGDAFSRYTQFFSHSSETDTPDVVSRRTERRASSLAQAGFAALLGTDEPGPLWYALEAKYPGVTEERRGGRRKRVRRSRTCHPERGRKGRQCGGGSFVPS